MGLTLFSIVLFPLCLLCIWKPDRLLQLVLMAGVFPAAAAVTAGGLGVQPNLVPAILFMGYVVLQLLLGARYPGARQSIALLTLFIIVTLYAIIGSIVFPRMFEDLLYVWPQKIDVIGGRVLLEPSSANVTQDFYIGINTVFLVLAAAFMTRTRFVPTNLIAAFYWSGLVASVIVFWQEAHRLAGVPFPETFFYSNPGWAVLTTQSFGPVPRINGSFAEPAAAASFLCSIVYSSAWSIVRGHASVLARIVLPVALLAAVLTTSTTGFATLAIGAAIMVVYCLGSGNAKLISRTFLAAVLVVGIVAIGALAITSLAPQVVKAAGTVMTATMSKTDSTSYNDRTSTDLDSLELGVSTYGLGTGWGSNRSSSLLPGLISEVGFVGVAGLLAFNVILFRHRQACKRLGADPQDLFVLDAAGAGLLGRLIAIGLSGPTIGAVDFYALLALLVATAVRIELRAGATRGLAARQETTVAPVA
jgi:hypothetical protein